MSILRARYNGSQHCTLEQDGKVKAEISHAWPPGGARSEELSPVELLAAGLASSMLFTLGLLGQQKNIDLTNTVVDVDVTMAQGPVERVGTINLTFSMPVAPEPGGRAKLESAIGHCPIKHSLHPDMTIHATFIYPEPVHNVREGSHEDRVKWWL